MMLSRWRERHLHVLAAAALLAGPSLSAGAQSPRDQPPGLNPPFSPLKPPADQTGANLVRMRMAADVTRIKPGEKFHLAFIFDIEPGWHIYWQNAGTSGAPTEIEVSAPPNFTVGRTLFPRPELIESPEGPIYGYERQVALLVEITPPLEAPAHVNFNASASWLVCKEVCKMGSASGTLSLQVGDVRIPSAGGERVDPLVDVFKQRVPKALKDLPTAEARFDGTELFISLPAQKFETAQFFPDDTPGAEYGEATIEKAGDQLRIKVPVQVKPHNAVGKPLRVAGVVGLGDSPEDPSFEFEIPLDADGRPRSD